MEHAPDPLKTGNIALLEVLEGLPDATVGAARDGRIVFVNGLAEEQFGYGRDELIGQPIETLWPERVRGRYRRNLDLYFELEHPLRFTERAYGRRKDGSRVHRRDELGDRRRATTARCCSRSAATSPSAWSRSRGCAGSPSSRRRWRRWASARCAASSPPSSPARRPSACARCSAPTASRCSTGPREIAAWGALGRSASSVSVPIHTGDRVHGGARRDRHRDEEAFGDEEGSFLQAVANVLAVGFSRLHLEEQMRHQALHDSLTGLANRTLCRDRILHALALSEREERSAAVLFVDLDNFKRVNDLFGHAAGDSLLIALAERMVAAVRPADTVARLGGDEFVVVCEDVDERTALALGWRVAAAVQEPVDGGGQRAPARGEHRDRARQRRGQRPRRADRPRRRRRLPGQGARHGAASSCSTRACAGAPPSGCGPRATSRARSSAASSSSSSSRSSRSRTATARSRTRRCCAGSASARRSARPSSSRSPRSRA